MNMNLRTVINRIIRIIPAISLSCIVGVVLIANSLVSGCSPFEPETDDKPFSWAIAPTIQFLTTDWKYAKINYTVGDTISVGFVDHFLYPDPGVTGRNWIAVFTTTSNDTEYVELLSGLFKSKLIPEYYEVGAKIVSMSSHNVTTNNGIIEVRGSYDYLTVNYMPYKDTTSIVLTDRLLIFR